MQAGIIYHNALKKIGNNLSIVFTGFTRNLSAMMSDCLLI